MGPQTLTDLLPFLADLPPVALDRIRAGFGLTDGHRLDGVTADELRQSERLIPGLWKVAEETLRRFPDTKLVDLVPAIGISDKTFGVSDASMRLFNVLWNNDLLSVERVRQLTLRSFLEFKNAGAKTARELLVIVALEATRAPARAVAGEQRERGLAEVQLLGAARTVIAWGVGDGRAQDPLQALAAAATERDLPAEVREALDTLRRVDPKVLVGPTLSTYDPRAVAGRIMGGFSERDRLVATLRVLAPGRRVTLQEIGDKYHITRERIRQVAKRARLNLEEAVRAPEADALTRRARRLRAELGSAFPIHELKGIGIALQDDPRPPLSSDEEYARLLLWVAGPYRLWQGWLVVDKGAELIPKTRSLLDMLTSLGPVDAEDALAALAAVDIREPYRRDWVVSLRGFRFIENSLVRWSGSVGDKAEMLLRLRGEPMSKPEILDALAEPRTKGTLANALGSDPRFRRRGLDLFGLAEWGGEEYTTIIEQMSEEISRRGGEARVDDLAKELAQKFGVSENSVWIYASGHHFVRSGRGTIRLRTEADGMPKTRSVADSRRCFRLEGGWAYRVLVTSEVLRGSGIPIVPGFATAAGVDPGGERRLGSSQGEIAINWRSYQPVMSAVRRAAESLGAEEGDYIFVVLAGEEAKFELVKRLSFESLQGMARMVAEAGRDPDAQDLLTEAASAVGLPGGSSAQAIARHLRARGEHPLAAHVDSGEGESETAAGGEEADEGDEE